MMKELIEALLFLQELQILIADPDLWEILYDNKKDKED